MKLSLLTAAAAATALFSATASQAAANDFGVAPVRVAPLSAVYSPAQAPLFEQTQLGLYFWGGHDYCWYFDGWHGPGWYWCGYRLRRGFGWGGVDGFHGWYGRGHPNGWRGGLAYHGGGYRGGGRAAPAFRGQGGHGGGHAAPAFRGQSVHGGGHAGGHAGGHGGGHSGGHDGGARGGRSNQHH